MEPTEPRLMFVFRLECDDGSLPNYEVPSLMHTCQDKLAPGNGCSRSTDR